MSEVYWAAYVTESVGTNQQLLADAINKPEQVPSEILASSVTALTGTADSTVELLPQWQFAGSGASILLDHFTSVTSADRVMSEVMPDALDVLLLGLDVIERGETVSADQALPVYLRDKVALTEAERGVTKPL